jgi:tRNA 2-thiouridine synthesizing protein E
MTKSRNDILHPGQEGSPEEFPDAPERWSVSQATEVADEEGLTLEPAHWELIRALQEYFRRNEDINVRELHDALDEKFHDRGGIKFLYKLMPGGPVAQGCRLAGLEAPAIAEDESFGSVQ